MANPSKAKGTKGETRVVKYLESHGIKAERKALAGAMDQGDIQVTLYEDSISAKARYITLEVKSGKMTENPSRAQLEEWLRQTVVEGNNCQQESYLVVARHNKNPANYDVWGIYRDVCRKHWFLDEWCEKFKERN